MPNTHHEPHRPLRDLAILFLKLGTLAFGGPAAHIAMMEEEVVRRRGWLSQEEFLDLLGATHLIPGPNSTEMAIHIGQRRAGWAGLAVAGACFILPATGLVMACAWIYTRTSALPQAEAILDAIKPVMIAVVLQALWSLSRAALKTHASAALSGVVFGMGLLGFHELALIGGGGLLMAWWRGSRRAGGAAFGGALPVLALQPWMGAAAPAAVAAAGGGGAAFGVWTLFLFFLKVGSVLYGSGYVLIAFLQGGLVERLGWITETQLLDAVAIGQMTPGPVFTTATFIGYILGGPWSAVVATAGIFLPAFVFVAVSGPLIPRLRKSRLAGAFLDGVSAASWALMGAVTVRLAGTALHDVWTWGIAACAAVLLLRYRVNSMWLILGGAALGLARLAF